MSDARRVADEFQRRLASQRLAEEWNTAGNWYVTRGFPGEQLYFLATGRYLKNGKAIGVLVTHQLERPRARPKAKKYQADRQWQQQFAKVHIVDVPPKVKESAARFFDEITSPAEDVVTNE